MADEFRAEISARPLAPGDGARVIPLYSRYHPLDNGLLAATPAIIDRLIEEERIVGAIVETVASEREASRVLAFGMNCFVGDDLSDHYMASPFPFFGSWLLSEIYNGRQDVLLDWDAQAAGNTGDGLNMIVFAYCQEYHGIDHVSSEFTRKMMAVIQPLYIWSYKGYNVKRLIYEMEEWGEPLMLATGHRRLADLIHQDPWSLGPHGHGSRAVYGLTREMARELVSGTLVAAVFVYNKPRFAFSPAEQRVLKQAIEGLTDEKIAQRLGISRDTIKQHWRAIYNRISLVAPELIGTRDETIAGTVRGREKRRVVITYVKDNVQELRPHLLHYKT